MGNGGESSVVIRYGSLAIVVLQTTITVLLLRYSRTRETSSPPYLASTAVLSSECCKFVVCVITLFVHAGKIFEHLIDMTLYLIFSKLFHDWNKTYLINHLCELQVIQFKERFTTFWLKLSTSQKKHVNWLFQVDYTLYKTIYYILHCLI